MPPKMAKAAAKNLEKQHSDVQAVDASGQVYKGFYVWVRVDPGADGTIFEKCLVMAGSTKENLKVRSSAAHGKEFEVKYKDVFNLNQNLDVFGFHDIGTLPHSNSPCVLDFLYQRLKKGEIYSTADPLLVAINPYKNLGNTTAEVIQKYRDVTDVTKLPPHVFSIARGALENLHMVRKSQTIIVSGESGAGKTEATKHIMRYFASPKSGVVDIRIQTAVLAANPVLEAFGNAKTVRNNNSSRFGRFMMLNVAAGGGITHGTVRNFLLEKSRILTQTREERNYHIFYQLLKGASPEMKKDLQLMGLDKYTFINPHCVDAEGINDIEEWEDVQRSLESMGMTTVDKNAIFSIVSGVLMMGNVKIVPELHEGVPDAAAIDPKSRDTFNRACDLLFLEAAKIEEGITIRQSIAGGKALRARWSAKDGEILKDSLCKGIYEKLFFYIVVRLNGNIEPKEWSIFMGMLDIFGFEVFQSNSLEQLFINITNEMLQKNFTDVVFDRETKLYRQEGISAIDLEWTSNDAVIEMLINKRSSLMAALDDQCLAPGGNDEKFMTNCYQMLKDNEKLIRPKVAGNVKFVVDHTIGEIQYNVEGFLFKNKDVLRPDLVAVVLSSKNYVTKALFEGVVMEVGKMKGQYIGAQFLKQLEELMCLINSTEPHFVRCVKPNESKKPLFFDQTKVILQLFSLSILEALQLRNLGYSYRRPFEDFLFQFKFIDLAVTQDSSLSKKDAAKKLMTRTKIEGGWQIGKTMIFLKPAVAKDLVLKQREAMSAWDPLCCVIEALWLRKSYRRGVMRTEKQGIRVQSHCRKRLWTTSI